MNQYDCMKDMKKCLLVLFAIINAVVTCAQITPYRFRTMSPSGGFGYDGVKDIEQDGAGFIWIMMDYELYRFDGYNYKKYYPFFAATQPNKRFLFVSLESDKNGHLFVKSL